MCIKRGRCPSASGWKSTVHVTVHTAVTVQSTYFLAIRTLWLGSLVFYKCFLTWLHGTQQVPVIGVDVSAYTNAILSNEALALEGKSLPTGVASPSCGSHIQIGPCHRVDDPWSYPGFRIPDSVIRDYPFYSYQDMEIPPVPVMTVFIHLIQEQSPHAYVLAIDHMALKHHSCLMATHASFWVNDSKAYDSALTRSYYVPKWYAGTTSGYQKVMQCCPGFLTLLRKPSLMYIRKLCHAHCPTSI